MRYLLLTLLFLCLTSTVGADVVGQPAPAWSVSSWTNLTPPRTRLEPSDLRGRVVCLFCFEAASEANASAFATLQKLAARYGHTGDTALVAVQTPTGRFDQNTAQQGRALMQRYGLRIPFGHDGGSQGSSPLAKRYGVVRTPWLVLIDKRSVVRLSGAVPAFEDAVRSIDGLRGGSTAGRAPAVPSNPLNGQPFGSMARLRWLTADGQPFRLQDHRYTLFRWWTDRCNHCTPSVGALSRLWQRYKDRGLHLVAVYHPKRRNAPGDAGVRSYARRIGHAGDIAFDDRWIKLRELMRRARFTRATSVSFLVDSQGVVRWTHPGPRIYWNRDPQWRHADTAIRQLDSYLNQMLPAK